MSPTNMITTQQSPTWRLGRGQALSLPAVRRARWLRVTDGELWLTGDGQPGEPAEDCWLGKGALSLLPADRAVVIEGHPRASFQLLEPVAAAVNGASPPLWRTW